MSQAPLQIVMIGTASKRMEQATQYLNRRDLQCSLATSIKAGFELIAKMNPKLVLLSWNLIGETQAQVVMNTIQSTFQVPLVIFAENGDGKTAVQLSNLPVRHVLHAPVSGPKIHMKILQVLKEFEEQGSAYFAPILSSDNSRAKKDVAVLGVGPRIQPPTSQQAPPQAVRQNLGTVHGPMSKTSLARSSHRALLEASRPPASEKASIQRVGVVHAMPIQSPNYKGYLLVMTDAQIEVDPVFLEVIREKLLSYLKETGDVAHIDEKTFAVEVGGAKVLPWAQEFADFLVLAQDGRNEVAMAFVRDNEAVPVFAESTSGEMVSMEIDRVPVGEPLTFDVFLHLPQNGKYIKYVRNGSEMSPEQVGRLKSSKVTQFHVRKEDRVRAQEASTRQFLRSKLLADRQPT